MVINSRQKLLTERAAQKLTRFAWEKAVSVYEITDEGDIRQQKLTRFAWEKAVSVYEIIDEGDIRQQTN